MASTYSSKCDTGRPAYTSDSSPRTISFTKRRESGLPVGVQGTDVQVSRDCSAFSSDMKSHTANTCDCMNKRRCSGVRIEV